MYDYFQQLTTLAPQFSALAGERTPLTNPGSNPQIPAVANYWHFSTLGRIIIYFYRQTQNNILTF